MFTSAGLSFGNWDRLRRDSTEHDRIYNKISNPSLFYPVSILSTPLTYILSKLSAHMYTYKDTYNVTLRLTEGINH